MLIYVMICFPIICFPIHSLSLQDTVLGDVDEMKISSASRPLSVLSVSDIQLLQNLDDISMEDRIRRAEEKATV